MHNQYSVVTDEIVRELENIAGIQNVFTSKDELAKYARDEMPVTKTHFPDVVVKTGDASQVSRILALSTEKNLPVTPRGGGTGVCGGCVPLYGGIVLSVEEMNRILEIDENNFVAVVEPGVTLADLYQATEERGLYYPLYPGEKTATLGGNVATNAGGLRAVKHGVTRHFVLGLEAVLPTGEIINTGGKFVKSSTGYDLTQLIVGSEGTLAVITKIMLRLIAPPSRREVLCVPFAKLEDAIKSVPDILKHKFLPVGIEFLERDILQIAQEFTGKEVPLGDGEAFLLIIVEVDTDEDFYRVSQQISEVCKKNGAVETYIPGSDRATRDLLEAREKFYPAAKSTGPLEAADVVVPRSMIPEFIAKVKEISRRHGVPIVAYGHAGDGNVHVHPMSRGMDVEQWKAKLPNVFNDIFEAGASLGGVVSGEHGLGFDKKAYLNTVMEKPPIKLMMRIKNAFDPNNILNPGKVFDYT
ncbi:MAG: FAD-binding oxidoreductase [Chloroflexota bacterium]|nr:FAD-binding oxidoreductase [Chloroflexota bacterium]